MKHPLTYRKASNDSWIQCFLCGHISRNRYDAQDLRCPICDIHHVNGIVEESSRLSPTPGDANHEQKLIVALFLALGKSMPFVPKHTSVEITEEEILTAWKKKESPVRIVSRDEIWGSGNVFKVLLENTKMKNVPTNIGGGLAEPAKKVRAFDFDLE